MTRDDAQRQPQEADRPDLHTAPMGTQSER